MTSTEIISIIALFLGVVVPVLTSIFAYRQVIAKVKADKAIQDEAEETRRLEVLAGVPKESAAAFDTGSRALREIIQFLSAQIEERDKVARETIDALRKELAERDKQHAQELTALRHEVQTLSERVEEQSHGIGLLTAQIEEYGKTPRYVRRKTGSLVEDG